MKVCGVLIYLPFALAACEPRDANSVRYQTFYVLPDGRYEVAGQVGDLSSAVHRLPSPADTRINVAACSSGKSAKVIQAMRALEAAGYDHIGFISTDARKQPACGL